jgi:hypothetical protein
VVLGFAVRVFASCLEVLFGRDGVGVVGGCECRGRDRDLEGPGASKSSSVDCSSALVSTLT